MKTKVSTIQFDYFKIPVQVKFYDFKEGRWLGGIAYKDEIICAECGEVIKFSSLYKQKIDIEPIQLLGDWIAFSEYIQ